MFSTICLFTSTTFSNVHLVLLTRLDFCLDFGSGNGKGQNDNTNTRID